jgi:methyl-accepting chemotaxis protein
MPSLVAPLFAPLEDRASPRIRAQRFARQVLDTVEAMERAALELARAIPAHTRRVQTALATLHELTDQADVFRRRYNEASSAKDTEAARRFQRELRATVRRARTQLLVLVHAASKLCGCAHAGGR